MRRLVLFDGVDLLPDAWRKALAPGPLRCFNPGLLRHGDGWLFAYRVVGPDGLRRIALCRLDPDFGVVAGSAVPFSDSVSFPPDGGLTPPATTWFADPRLYHLEGRLFLYWNSGWHEPHNHQFLQELDGATLSPVGAPRELRLAGERQAIEKNWTIFGDGPLHAVYSVAPHRILQLSLDGDGPIALTEAAVTAWDPGDYPARFGELRGGAVPQRVGERYVSFCHSVHGPGHGEYRYVPSVYAFSASFPFVPTGAPVRPLPLENPLGTSTADGRLNPAVCEVVYPCGAAHDDGRWIVSYGLNDERCAIAVLAREDVDACLREWPDLPSASSTDAPPLDGDGWTGLEFDSFDNGARIPDLVRRLWRGMGGQRERFGNPFETGREGSFYDWLTSPHRSGSPLTRLQAEILRHRGDVAAAFPDAEGVDAPGYLRWILAYAGPEMGLDDHWLALAREQLDGLVRARDAEAAREEPAEKRRQEPGEASSRRRPAGPGQGPEPRAEAAPGSRRPGFLNRLRDVVGLFGARPRPDGRPAPGEAEPTASASASAEATGGAPPAAAAIPAGPGPFGVNLFGYFDTESGIGEIARSLAAMLAAAGVPHVLVNVEQQWLRRECRPGLRFSGEHPFPVNLLAVNADQAPHVVERFGLERSRDRYFVGYWFWELSSFPSVFSGAFPLFDEIWAATDFCHDAFARAGAIPVAKVPPAFELGPAARRERAAFGWTESEFVFLYVFDSASVVARKNPAATVSAFRRAFRPDEPVRLVLKTTNAPAKTVRALERLAGPSRVEVRNGYLARGELLALLNASDAYVSLHRSEGLGLTVLEAMMLGKPVAATGYSGVKDFLEGPLAFPVSHEVVPLLRNHGPYPKGAVWAEPDRSDAARQMRRIFDLRRDDPGWPRVADRAAVEARRRWTVEATAPALARRLDVIRALLEARR